MSSTIVIDIIREPGGERHEPWRPLETRRAYLYPTGSAQQLADELDMICQHDDYGTDKDTWFDEKGLESLKTRLDRLHTTDPNSYPDDANLIPDPPEGWDSYDTEITILW